MNCPKCGAEIPANGRFCLECGTLVEQAQAQAQAPVNPQFNNAVPAAPYAPAVPAAAKPGMTPEKKRIAIIACAAVAVIVLVVVIISIVSNSGKIDSPIVGTWSDGYKTLTFSDRGDFTMTTSSGSYCYEGKFSVGANNLLQLTYHKKNLTTGETTEDRTENVEYDPLHEHKYNSSYWSFSEDGSRLYIMGDYYDRPTGTTDIGGSGSIVTVPSTVIPNLNKFPLI